MNWIIKSIYPSGGHTVMLNGNPMRFPSKQAALDYAEILTGEIRKSGTSSASYIVVEDAL